MPFTDLPNEVICLVGKYLPQKSISSLMQITHRLCDLLQKTLYDNTPKSETNRILIWACRHGRVDLAREMLKRGGAEQRPEYGPRPLAIAAVHGHVDVLKLILDQEGTNPNEACFATSTALIHAAAAGHLEAVKTLLKHTSVRPDQADVAGRTPFFFATENDNVSVMKELLKTGQVDLSLRDRYFYGRSPIHYAAGRGREEAIRFILSLPNTDPEFRDAQGSTPLSIAAEAGASGVVKILLETGRVDANARDHRSRTPLHRVFDKIRRYDKENDGAEEEKEKIRRMLAGEVISQYSSASELRQDRTKEHTLTGDGYEVMRQLLALQDIDLEPCDSEGRTPLSYAAGVRSVEGTRLLIATGKVDLESKDNDGWSPTAWLEGQVKPKPTPDDSDSEFEIKGNLITD